jgi:hypothetical protein
VSLKGGDKFLPHILVLVSSSGTISGALGQLTVELEIKQHLAYSALLLKVCSEPKISR